MAIKVKDISQSADKWADNAGRSAERFAVEAEAAAEAWARNTGAAADNYHQAVTGPGIKERFRKGVSRAGAAKFARKIRDVAKPRGHLWFTRLQDRSRAVLRHHSRSEPVEA